MPRRLMCFTSHGRRIGFLVILTLISVFLYNAHSNGSFTQEQDTTTDILDAKYYKYLETTTSKGVPIYTSKNKNCTAHTKIAFMKTHKTASSSVQNILFRYGIDLKLNFVLPKSGNHLNDPAHPYVILEPFKIEWLDLQIEKLPWHSQLKAKHNYDIFNLHTQWNSSAVRYLLGPKAVTFTILRHPVDLFESLYAYANFQTILKLTLHEYIQMLNVSQSLHQHRINQYLGLNQQLFDLGVPAMDLSSQNIVDKRIQELQKELDFVLLADRFDESMVLLASKLCWPLEYVRSLKINARKKSFKVTLDAKQKSILEKWQTGDLKLYNHYKHKFEKMIEDYGVEQMAQDVERLQNLNQQAREKCVIEESDKSHMDEKSLYRPFSSEVVAFKVRQNIHECRLLGMAENSLVELARTKQQSHWMSSKKP